MLGRTYYMTTLAAWLRSAGRFATSHYAHTNPANERPAGRESTPESTPETTPETSTAKILALVEADEGVHNSLAADPEWEPLPHPLTNKPVSEATAAALTAHGVTPNATTYDVADAIALAHPIMAYRVF